MAGVDRAVGYVERTGNDVERARLRWMSEDGPDRDVHATLEAIHALRISGR